MQKKRKEKKCKGTLKSTQKLQSGYAWNTWLAYTVCSVSQNLHILVKVDKVAVF